MPSYSVASNVIGE